MADAAASTQLVRKKSPKHPAMRLPTERLTQMTGRKFPEGDRSHERPAPRQAGSHREAEAPSSPRSPSPPTQASWSALRSWCARWPDGWCWPCCWAWRASAPPSSSRCSAWRPSWTRPASPSPEASPPPSCWRGYAACCAGRCATVSRCATTTWPSSCWRSCATASSGRCDAWPRRSWKVATRATWCRWSPPTSSFWRCSTPIPCRPCSSRFWSPPAWWRSWAASPAPSGGLPWRRMRWWAWRCPGSVRRPADRLDGSCARASPA